MLDKIVLVNDAAVFVCAANAWPRPEYVWLKDGKMLDLTSSNLQIIKKQNAQHLIVLHAEYSDAGRYKCRVSNPLGSIELSSRLKVVKDLPGTPHSPGKQIHLILYFMYFSLSFTLDIVTKSFLFFLQMMKVFLTKH
jgi:hypothetical protein